MSTSRAAPYFTALPRRRSPGARGDGAPGAQEYLLARARLGTWNARDCDSRGADVGGRSLPSRAARFARRPRPPNTPIQRRMLRHGRSKANEAGLIVSDPVRILVDVMGGVPGGRTGSQAHRAAAPSPPFLPGQRRETGVRPDARRAGAGDGRRVRAVLALAWAGRLRGAAAAQPPYHPLISSLPPASLRWKAELGDAAAATLLIVASPFSRTVETATQASAAVGISPGDARFQTHPSLRERHFGDFELQTHDHYKTVWVEDARDLAWRPPGAQGGRG